MAKSRPSGARRKADADSFLLREDTSGFVTQYKAGDASLTKIASLRKEIQEYAKRFSGENSFVKNQSSGFDIGITRKSIREATSGRRQVEELEALRKLPGMLRRATYIGAEPERKGKFGVKQIHIFEAIRKIFNKSYVFTIKVVERGNGKFFYDSYTKK